MRLLLYILPVALLVAYSQLMVKWRSSQIMMPSTGQHWPERLLGYFSDPFIVSAYAAALFSALLWLVVVTRIPLSVGFPVYIGSAFLLVMAGSVLILGEPLNLAKLLAAGLILAGILIMSQQQ